MKFTYTITTVNRSLDPVFETEKYLNQMGAGGWELVQIIDTANVSGMIYTPVWRFIFKRRASVSRKTLQTDAV